MTHGTGEVTAVIDFSYQRLVARDAAALLPLLTVDPGPALTRSRRASMVSYMSNEPTNRPVRWSA